MTRVKLLFAAILFAFPQVSFAVPDAVQNKLAIAFPDGNEFDITDPAPVTIQVMASFASDNYAFAAASFDLTADNSGSFFNPFLMLNGPASFAGTAVDTGVVGMSESQLHIPSMDMLANTTNPLVIWEVQWTTDDFTLREIDFKTDASELWFYTDSNGGSSSFFMPGIDATGTIYVVPSPPSILLLSFGLAWRRRRTSTKCAQINSNFAPIQHCNRRTLVTGACIALACVSTASAQIASVNPDEPTRHDGQRVVLLPPGTPDNVVSETDRAVTQEQLNELKKKLDAEIEKLKKQADDGNEEAQEALDEAKKAKSLLEQGLLKLTNKTATALQLAKLMDGLLDPLCKLPDIIDTVFDILKNIIENIVDLINSIIDGVKKIFEGSEAEHQAISPVEIPGHTDFTSVSVVTHICIEPELGLHDAPIVLELTNCISDFTVDAQSTEDPDVFELTIISLTGFAASFDLLPGMPTGDNTQTLDDSFTSKGTYNSLTGEVQMVLHTKIVNDLFPADNPVLVLSIINSEFDETTGTLTTRSDAFDFVNLQSVPTELLVLPDDGFVEQPLQFTFDGLGDPVQSVFIGSNGFITLGEGDDDPTPTVAEFLGGPPRFAALWTDLDPSAGGEVSIDSDPDRLAVYFRDVPVKDGNSGTVSFVIVLSSDGYLVADNRGMVTTGGAICGFSRGGDVTSGSETESDLTDPFLPHGILSTDTAIFEEFAQGEPLDLPLLAFGFYPGVDCNANEVDDNIDIVTAVSSDCNANGIPDECDISSGESIDLDGNGIPDECECYADFDQSSGVSVLDVYDYLAFMNSYIAQESRSDCDSNGIFDASDIACYFASFDAGCP
jgi:Skp family chaperone for outer membrane proteins